MLRREAIAVAAAGIVSVSSRSAEAAGPLHDHPAPSPTGFRYGGSVIDQQGNPISGVQIVATHRHESGKGFGYIDSVESDGKGLFKIARPQAVSGATPDHVNENTI